MSLVVLDDFLPEGHFARLVRAVNASDFPWMQTHVLEPGPRDLDPAHNVQEVHGFLQRKPGYHHVSDYMPVLDATLRQLDAGHVFKIKLNRTPRLGVPVVYGWHCDTRVPEATTGVFYLNTNNGGTAFEDGRHIDSLANRLVLFDARLRHSGVSCTDAPHRLVLNLNFIARPGMPGDFFSG